MFVWHRVQWSGDSGAQCVEKSVVSWGKNPFCSNIIWHKYQKREKPPENLTFFHNKFSDGFFSFFSGDFLRSTCLIYAISCFKASKSYSIQVSHILYVLPHLHTEHILHLQILTASYALYPTHLLSRLLLRQEYIFHYG